MPVQSDFLSIGLPLVAKHCWGTQGGDGERGEGGDVDCGEGGREGGGRFPCCVFHICNFD